MPGDGSRAHRGKPCTVAGCDRPNYGRGLCEMHHGRWRRTGDPHTVHDRSGQIVDAPPDAPDPRPVVMLRLELERSRALDTSFAYAWSFAMRAALGSLAKPLRDEWREALADTRPAWQSAYYRLPAPELKPFELLHADTDAIEPWFSFRRSAPDTVTTGPRHDAPGTLEPVVVPWCN